MTKQKSFKRLVRARMDKTGESYTAARASLLAAEPPNAADAPVLPTSDAAIRARTGRGWEEWFDALDEWGATERPHRDIARWVAEQLGVDPLAWDAQAVTVSFERARGGRAVGQHPEGFSVTVTRTVAVPVERLFAAFVDERARGRWLPHGRLRERTATAPKSARFDVGDGPERLHLVFDAKGETRSTVALEHARLPGGEQADRAKAHWRERLGVLKAQLEGGDLDV
jgi:hypothetical protein